MNYEDFCTYEQAELLKELGFDWKCVGFYSKYKIASIEHDMGWDGGMIIEENYNNAFIANNYDVLCSAPTLSQVQKWLRDVKRIHIVIDAVHRMNCDGTYTIFYPYTIKDWEGRILNNFGLGYECYESSLEDAIDKALELLKENQ